MKYGNIPIKNRLECILRECAEANGKEGVRMKVYKSKKMEQAILRTYDALLAQWGVETEEIDVATRYGSTHAKEGIHSGEGRLYP